MNDQKDLRKEKWYWPTIIDLSSAINASNKGVWASVIVVVITGVIAATSLVLAEHVAGVGVWGFIDAAVFGAIAFGIRRRSRICAVAGLVLFILEKILQLAAFGLGIRGIGRGRILCCSLSNWY